MSKVRDRDPESGPAPVLTFDELAEVVKQAPPPTDDDVTLTWDGRAINTKEKLLAWLKEIEAQRAAGITAEELEKRAEGIPGWAHIDWAWDPVADPRV